MAQNHNFRRSDTGRYTTKEYADKHPKETEKEKRKPSKEADKRK